MVRKAEKISPFVNVDLTKPVNKSELRKMVAEDSCLGLEWDMRSKECPICSMNDICGTLFQDVVNQKVKEVEAKNPTFLDKTDFNNINPEILYQECIEKSGQLTVKELFEKVKTLACTIDEVAVLEWVKRFKLSKNLKFRGDVVWKE